MLKAEFHSKLDPMQFAYKHNRNTTDALATFLHIVTSHLDRCSTNTVRCLFVDFSSAFYTIPPPNLISKLTSLYNLPNFLSDWIFDFLTDRTQYVAVEEKYSKYINTNIGSPQGCILSPFLFSIYTNDLIKLSETVDIIKFADDTLVVGKISNDDSNEYFRNIDHVLKWCSTNGLVLN